MDYVRDLLGIRKMDRILDAWISCSVKDCLNKGGLGVRQARRILQNRSESLGSVRRNAWGVS